MYLTCPPLQPLISVTTPTYKSDCPNISLGDKAQTLQAGFRFHAFVSPSVQQTVQVPYVSISMGLFAVPVAATAGSRASGCSGTDGAPPLWRPPRLLCFGGKPFSVLVLTCSAARSARPAVATASLATATVGQAQVCQNLNELNSTRVGHGSLFGAHTLFVKCEIHSSVCRLPKPCVQDL